MKDVFVYDAIRSPRAKAKESGGLHDLLPHELLKSLYASLVERTGLDPAMVGDVEASRKIGTSILRARTSAPNRELPHEGQVALRLNENRDDTRCRKWICCHVKEKVRDLSLLSLGRLYNYFTTKIMLP